MSKHWKFVLVAAVLATFRAHAQSAPPALQWHVENRFPMLQVDAFKEVEKMWASSPNKSMWGFIVHRLETLENGPREAFVLVDPRKANSASNAATDDRVLVRLDANVPDSAACRWSVSPAPLKAPDEGKCSDTLEISRNSPTSVSVQHAEGSASVVVEVDDIVVVAMGDSYASGEGSPDRPAIYKGFSTPKRNDWFHAGAIPARGTVEPAMWLDETCHRSMLSWPVLSSLRLALEHPKAVVRLVNVACSGAKFIDGIFFAQAQEDKLG